jgi:hypothetical protein
MQGQEIVADLLHCVESGSKPSTSTSEKQIGQPLLIVNLSICCAELELRDVLMLCVLTWLPARGGRLATRVYRDSPRAPPA